MNYILIRAVELGFVVALKLHFMLCTRYLLLLYWINAHVLRGSNDIVFVKVPIVDRVTKFDSRTPRFENF